MNELMLEIILELTEDMTMEQLAERITESEERIADYKGYIKTYGSYLQPVRRIAEGVKLKT